MKETSAMCLPSLSPVSNDTHRRYGDGTACPCFQSILAAVKRVCAAKGTINQGSWLCTRISTHLSCRINADVLRYSFEEDFQMIDTNQFELSFSRSLSCI